MDIRLALRTTCALAWRHYTRSRITRIYLYMNVALRRRKSTCSMACTHNGRKKRACSFIGKTHVMLLLGFARAYRMYLHIIYRLCEYERVVRIHPLTYPPLVFLFISYPFEYLNNKHTHTHAHIHKKNAPHIERGNHDLHNESCSRVVCAFFSSSFSGGSQRLCGLEQKNTRILNSHVWKGVVTSDCHDVQSSSSAYLFTMRPRSIIRHIKMRTR